MSDLSTYYFGLVMLNMLNFKIPFLQINTEGITTFPLFTGVGYLGMLNGRLCSKCCSLSQLLVPLLATR